jgi:hypothetical protein
VQPGNQVVFGHSVRNLGVVDTYDIKIELPVGESWSVSYYNDVDANGLYDAGTDAPLTDSNGNGVPDTGSILTDQTAYFLAVWTIPADQASATHDMTLTATSGIDGAVSKTSEDVLKVGDATTILFLHNRPSPPIADTTGQVDLAMDIDDPSATTLFKYSTDNGGQVGRRVNQGNTDVSVSDPKKYVNWVYQVDQTSIFDGNAVLNLWGSAKDFHCDKAVEIFAYMRWKTSATINAGTSMGSGSYVLPKDGAGCSGWRQFTINIAVDATVDTNNWIEVKVVVHDDVANHENGQFAYDTTTYPATLTLPQVFS